mmetsp:Transcript_27957/g.71126  ORF Transcript_27957/g.71126 Transcript_27957/m.71126 type:complete len:184 (-) Transcript_27957:54-605(-)
MLGLPILPHSSLLIVATVLHNTTSQCYTYRQLLLSRVGVLHNNKEVLLIGCNHDFMLLRADAKEGEVILWVQVPYYRPGLLCELGDESSVLHRQVVLQVGTNGDALAVHDDRAHHTLVGADALESFFYFRHVGKRRLKTETEKSEQSSSNRRESDQTSTKPGLKIAKREKNREKGCGGRLAAR